MHKKKLYNFKKIEMGVGSRHKEQKTSKVKMNFLINFQVEVT